MAWLIIDHGTDDLIGQCNALPLIVTYTVVEIELMINHGAADLDNTGNGEYSQCCVTGSRRYNTVDHSTDDVIGQ